MYYYVGDEGVAGTGGPQTGRCHVCDGDGFLSPLHTYLLLAGRRLKRYRERRGISAFDLSKEIGVEAGDVQSMENGVFSLACVVRGYSKEHRATINKLLQLE